VIRICPQHQPDPRLGYTLLLGGTTLPVRESGLKWVPVYYAPPHTSMNSKYIAGSPLIRFISSQLGFGHHHYVVGFVRPEFSWGLLGPRHERHGTEQEVPDAGWNVRRMMVNVDRCHDGCATVPGRDDGKNGGLSCPWRLQLP
jgi:hypothetical protein